MKLKTRLTVSFCIILFVPILLAVVVVMGFQKYQFKTIETTYGLEAGNYRDLMNPLQLLNRYTKGNYEILMQKVSENPDHFLDPDFLNRMNEELQHKYSYLLVRKEEDIIYAGQKTDLQEEDLPG